MAAAHGLAVCFLVESMGINVPASRANSGVTKPVYETMRRRRSVRPRRRHELRRKQARRYRKGATAGTEINAGKGERFIPVRIDKSIK
jgi:hypothetical protein